LEEVLREIRAADDIATRARMAGGAMARIVLANEHLIM
jgi:hypothetical protein